MSITSESIERFFRNECHAEEAAKVADYLERHPEELDHYLSLDSMTEKDVPVKPSTRRSERILRAIRRNTYGEQASIHWFRYVAAASVIVLLTIGGSKFFGKATSGTTVARLSQKTDSILPLLQSVENTGTGPMRVNLEDGSEITLMPGTALQYFHPFQAHKRQLYIDGTAFFKVAPDFSRSFIVTGQGFNTTVLGTSFRIESLKRSDKMTVQLFTGKVSVSKDGDEQGRQFKKVYLRPGSQLKINTSTLLASMTTIEDKKELPVKNDSPVGELSSDSLVFRNTLLPSLFRTIVKEYHVIISYDSGQVGKITFTGSFSHSQNVAAVLKDIAVLNGLTVSATDSGYMIKK